MKKQYLLLQAFVLAAGLSADTLVMAQTTLTRPLFGENKLIRELREQFGSGTKTVRPPFPMPPAAHRKPTALQSRMVAMYNMTHDGVGYNPTGDSIRYFWSGNRGAGTDYTQLMGVQYELYAQQYPVSYGMLQLNHMVSFYQFDSVHHYQWSSTAGRFDTLDGRGISKLNSRGYITTLSNLEYDAGSGIWENDYREVLTYEGDTALRSNLFQNWDGTGWENDERISWVYDGGKISEIKEEDWDGTAWENDDRSVFSHTGNDITDIVDQRWDNIASAWENRYKSRYTYDGANRTRDIQQDWDGTAWENDTRQDYTFNAAGQLTESLYLRWSAGAWENRNKYTYAYNASGDIISWLNEEWDGAAWENDRKISYEYTTASGKTTVRITIEEWDDVASVWENDYRFIIEYNSYGQITALSSEEWDAGGFWDVPAGNSKMIFLYEEFEDGSTHVADAEKRMMKVYPNPANSRIHIEGSLTGTVRIMDMNGREVWKGNVAPQAERMDIPTVHLAPGTYILQANNNGKMEHLPVTIQR